MAKKITIYSGENMKNTLEQIKRIANRLEEKEDQSIVRSIWSILKKPVIGKSRQKK